MKIASYKKEEDIYSNELFPVVKIYHIWLLLFIYFTTTNQVYFYTIDSEADVCDFLWSISRATSVILYIPNNVIFFRKIFETTFVLLYQLYLYFTDVSNKHTGYKTKQVFRKAYII